MVTQKETVTQIVDRLGPLDVRARAMFGGYGLYCDEKIVGLICDDSLFIKPSSGSSEFLGELELSPPYPGAKDYHRVSPKMLEEDDWLRDVIQRTADALPMPKPKKPRT